MDSALHEMAAVTGIDFDATRLEEAAAELSLDLIVAFGSRVGGDLSPKADSDLDIAVLDRRPFTWKRFREVYGALGDVFRTYDLDLAFITEADPLFRFQIFLTAERLSGSRQLFCEQQCYAKKAYVDSRDLRDLESTLYERKLEYIDRILDRWAEQEPMRP